jgi:hypothetical protein
MSCPRCNGVGYLETWVMRDARMQGLVQQCCDIKAYSERIMRGSASPSTAPAPRVERSLAKVIHFVPRKSL